MENMRINLVDFHKCAGYDALLKQLAPLLFVGLFASIQFSSQRLLGVPISRFMFCLSVITAGIYWFRFSVVPSAGIRVIFVSMFFSTVLLLVGSAIWRENSAFIKAVTIFLAASALTKCLPARLFSSLLRFCCMSAFVITIVQVVSGVDNAHIGIGHPDFGWAMYGTTLPGQGVYLALWGFIFVPAFHDSRCQKGIFYAVFVFNCVAASLFSIRLMIPILLLSTVFPWGFQEKFAKWSVRCLIMLCVLLAAIILPKLVVQKSTNVLLRDPLLDRFSTILEDGGSGRVELYKLGLNDLTHKSIPNLIFGSGAMYTVKLTNGRDMHNIYLEMLHSCGIMGLTGLLVLLFSVIRHEYSTKFSQPIGSVIIAYFFAGLFIFGFCEPAIWFMLGCYEASRNQSIEKAVQAVPTKTSRGLLCKK